LGFAAERDFAPVEDILTFDLATDFLWTFAPAFDFNVDLAISCEFRPMCVNLIGTPPHNTGVLFNHSSGDKSSPFLKKETAPPFWLPGAGNQVLRFRTF
jgi:hypothetical protein